MRAGGSPKRKCAEKKIEAPPVGVVPRSNCRGLSPKKPSSLIGPQKLNPKAAAQLRFTGCGNLFGTGEADVSVASTLPLSIGFLSGSFPSPAADRSCTEGGRPCRGARQAPCNRPSACGARRPPLPQPHGDRARSSKGGLEGRGQRSPGAAEEGPGRARACWGRGLFGVALARGPGEGRSQPLGHGL